MSYISEERKAISTFLPYPFKPQVPVEIAVLNGLLYYKGPNNVCIPTGEEGEVGEVPDFRLLHPLHLLHLLSAQYTSRACLHQVHSIAR